MVSKKSNANVRLMLALIWPIIFGAIAHSMLNGSSIVAAFPFAPALCGLGITAYLLGRRWYTNDELGFRAGRPMMAGAGFAFLGWISLFLARLIYAGFAKMGSDLGSIYLYLLFCEALCAQLWVFGLFFRVMSDWRGGIAATWWSALLYGLVAFQLFAEAYNLPKVMLLYFIIWGMLYAIIRLRTGSWLGTVLIQSIQTLTVWHLFPAVTPAFSWIYGMSGLLYLVLIWRLIPKFASDLRV